METKPGVKTSEFLVLVATLAAGFLNKKLGLDVDPLVLAAMLGSVSSYILSRGWAKKPSAPAGLPPFLSAPKQP